MQYCFTILLCAMRCFKMEQELTCFLVTSGLTLLLFCLLSITLPNGNFLWVSVVIVVVDVVCGCDIKLLLGRIILDLWSPWKFEACGNLYPALHIPTDSMLLVSSTCFLKDISFLFPFHYRNSSLITLSFSISCSCAVQLYCGPTQAFTQYIKLN